MTKAIDIDLLDELFDNQKILDNHNIFDDPIVFSSQKNEIKNKEEFVYLQDTENNDELYSEKRRSIVSILIHVVVMALIIIIYGFLFF